MKHEFYEGQQFILAIEATDIVPYTPLGYHPDLIFFPLYGSHMCNQSVEKYPLSLLDQSLLSSKPYASGMSTTTMLMHWWTRLS